MIVVPGEHLEIAASPAHRFAPPLLRVSEVAHHAYPERIEPLYVIRRQVRQHARAVDPSTPDAAAIVGLVAAQVAKISSAFEDQLSFHARDSNAHERAEQYSSRWLHGRSPHTRTMSLLVCKRCCPLSTLVYVGTRHSGDIVRNAGVTLVTEHSETVRSERHGEIGVI